MTNWRRLIRGRYFCYRFVDNNALKVQIKDGWLWYADSVSRRYSRVFRPLCLCSPGKKRNL